LRVPHATATPSAVAACPAHRRCGRWVGRRCWWGRIRVGAACCRAAFGESRPRRSSCNKAGGGESAARWTMFSKKKYVGTAGWVRSGVGSMRLRHPRRCGLVAAFVTHLVLELRCSVVPLASRQDPRRRVCAGAVCWTGAHFLWSRCMSCGRGRPSVVAGHHVGLVGCSRRGQPCVGAVGPVCC